MPRDRFPPSIVPQEESESEEEEEEEEEEEVEDERVDGDAGTRKEAEAEAEVESEDEEDSSEKTNSQVRGLDYGSDADSGRTCPSPSASAFVIKQNSKPETQLKKRSSELQKAMGKVKRAKKEKKGNGGVDVAAEDKGRRSSGGQRIWGPEDELMILTGMLEYKEKTGVDLNSNSDAFYKYINGSLKANVDKSQLSSKIRKLKEKYRSNAQKEANGEAPVFLKDHEEEAYEHSKKIWGGKAVGRGSQGVKSKPKSKTEVNVASKSPILELENVLALPVPEIEASKREVNDGSAKAASRARKAVKKMDMDDADVEMKDYNIPMPPLADNLVVEKGLEFVEKSKVDALNEKWTQYRMDAAQLYLRRLDLVIEQTKAILDALKSKP